MERLADGRVRLALKPPWADGSAHLTFEPLEFIGRLSAQIPFPTRMQTEWIDPADPHTITTIGFRPERSLGSTQSVGWLASRARRARSR